MIKNNNVETASQNVEPVIKNHLDDKAESKVTLTEFHSKEYLKQLAETTYKGKKVVFILPNGKEYKNVTEEERS